MQYKFDQIRYFGQVTWYVSNGADTFFLGGGGGGGPKAPLILLINVYNNYAHTHLNNDMGFHNLVYNGGTLFLFWRGCQFGYTIQYMY